MNDKIRDLHRQIAEEKRKISNCKHEFGKPFSNPETKQEGYGYRMVGQGSDVWGEYVGYRPVEVPRWTRVCELCGHEEHTYEQKPNISGYVPRF